MAHAADSAGNASRPIPKSLHTVTALVSLARWLMANARDLDHVAPQNTAPTKAQAAIADAAEILGLAGRDDPHGVIAAAVKQLEA